MYSDKPHDVNLSSITHKQRAELTEMAEASEACRMRMRNTGTNITHRIFGSRLQNNIDEY